MKRLLILTSLLIFTACAAATEPPTPTLSPSPSVTASPSPRPIITVRPSATPKPTTTPYPTVAFAEPPLQPANYDGPIPAGAIARLGKGDIRAMAITHDKQVLIVGGNIGLYAYRIEDFQAIWASPVDRNVQQIATNPVDHTLVTGMSDGSIVVWDSESGDMLYTMTDSHDSHIVQVAYNATGTLIASASNDSIVMIWDAQTGELLQTLDPGHEGIGRIAWLPGEDKLIIGSTYTTTWDVTNTELTFTSADYNQGITGFVFAPDSTLLVELTNGGYSITLREAYSGEVVHELTERIVPTMSRGVVTSVSPDNTILAVGGGDGLITLWDLTTGQQLSALSGHIDQIVSLEFDHDSHTIYSSAQDGWIIEWDIGTGKPLRAVRDHAPNWRTVHALAWSPDGATLAYAYGGVPHALYDLRRLARMPDTVLLWNRADQTYIAYPAQVGHVDIGSLAYSPDGSLLAAGSLDGPVILWDVETIQPQFTSLVTDCCIDFSADGELIATAAYYGRVSIGDGHTGEVFRYLERDSSPYAIHSQALSIDNSRLFLGSDGAIVVIDAVSGEEVDQFETGYVHTIALSPDGTKLVAGLNDGSIEIWDTNTGARILGIHGLTGEVGSVSWSPDGRFILSGSGDGLDGLAIVWDAQTGEQLYTLDGHASAIASVAWSPDMQYIATGSHDGTVVIWEAQ